TFETARVTAEDALAQEQEARRQQREAQVAHNTIREQLASAERAASALLQRVAALTEAEERLQGDAGEARRALEDATMSLEGLQPDEELRARANELRDMVGRLRVELTEARARHESMKREAEARSRRLAGIIDERRAWELRSTNAERQI